MVVNKVEVHVSQHLEHHQGKKLRFLSNFPFFSERIHSSSVCSVFDKVLRKSIMESVHSLFLSIASRGFSMVNVHYSIRVLTWLL